MTIDRGLLAILEAKPGRGDDLGTLLEQARELALEEPGTQAWYAFRISETTFGIFDTFADEEGRQAHVNGKIPAALAEIAADLLAAAPDIRPLDLVAHKQPS